MIGGIGLENKQWKYKIGSGKTPVILTFIMLALFGGLALWLHSTQNGAFIFAGLLAAVMLLSFAVTVYRFLYYKILIGKDGFYYQTGPGNGRYYEYASVEKAWISSGTQQNGVQQKYCNVVIPGIPVIRFPFYYADSKGVGYLVKRVDASASKDANIEAGREYLIDGKVYGKTGIVIGFLLLAIVAFIDTVIIQNTGLIYLIVPGTIMAVAVVWMLIIRYCYFKVRIGESGFYCRTNPFNGQHYQYNEITSCREIKRIIRNRKPRRGVSHRRYYFYFEFTDVRGKTRKFQFEKPIHEYEVNVLKERIEQGKQ